MMEWRDSYSGERTGSMAIVTAPSGMTLSFSVGGVPVRQQIALTQTTCFLGGKRYWFSCPGCGRPCLVLLYQPLVFTCRRCAGASYASQCLDEQGRIHRRLAKLERRLVEGTEKPRWMRLATYQRILDRTSALQERLDDLLIQSLARLGIPDLLGV